MIPPKRESKLWMIKILFSRAAMLLNGIVPRYPSEMEFDDLETEEALHNAEIILDWAKEVLP